jgi:hypothetical protein
VKINLFRSNALLVAFREKQEGFEMSQENETRKPEKKSFNVTFATTTKLNFHCCSTSLFARRVARGEDLGTNPLPILQILQRIFFRSLLNRIRLFYHYL